MGTAVADVVPRYGDLARLACESPSHLFLKSADLEPQVLLASTHSPTTRGSFFRDLLDLALRGVFVPDDLFAVCLRPLAQALYFREFHNTASKDRLVVAVLMDWLENKHNGYVSRGNNGNHRNLKIRVVLFRLTGRR